MKIPLHCGRSIRKSESAYYTTANAESVGSKVVHAEEDLKDIFIPRRRRKECPQEVLDEIKRYFFYYYYCY